MARGEIMKTVAVSDDVYKILIRIKYEKNFKNVSEVIDYLIKRNNNAGR
jgi:predicted CopG family antitoxin